MRPLTSDPAEILTRAGNAQRLSMSPDFDARQYQPLRKPSNLRPAHDVLSIHSEESMRKLLAAAALVGFPLSPAAAQSIGGAYTVAGDEF